MSRLYEIRQKEVINIKDGSRLGFVSDLEIDTKCGRIKQIILPCQGKLFGVFGHEKEYRIDWDDIKRIGDDIIIIEADMEDILEDT